MEAETQRPVGAAPVTAPAPDLAELRRLHETATPAPWSPQRPGRYPCIDVRAPLSRRGEDISEWPLVTAHQPGVADDWREEAQANAALIAAMRNALPWLLDRAEAAEAALRPIADESMRRRAEAEARAEAAEARVWELEAALRPFAGCADSARGVLRGVPNSESAAFRALDVTIGDLRRAARALSSQTEAAVQRLRADLKRIDEARGLPVAAIIPNDVRAVLDALDAAAPDREADAFRRGAEAMREAAAQWHEREAAHIEAVDGPDQALWSAEHREHAAEIRALPIPGDENA